MAFVNKKEVKMRSRRLIFNTISNTRRTLARLVKDYYEDNTDIEPSEMRLLLDYGKQIIAAHKIETELKVEAEVQEIKSKLKEKGIL